MFQYKPALFKQEIIFEYFRGQIINIALPILLVVIFGFIYQQYRRYRFGLVKNAS